MGQSADLGSVAFFSITHGVNVGLRPAKAIAASMSDDCGSDWSQQSLTAVKALSRSSRGKAENHNIPWSVGTRPCANRLIIISESFIF